MCESALRVRLDVLTMELLNFEDGAMLAVFGLVNGFRRLDGL